MVSAPKRTLGIPLSMVDATRFIEAAGARGMTQTEFLVALLDFHEQGRALAETPLHGAMKNDRLSDLLERLKLQTVVR